jgi:hypothetical protein
MPIIADKGTQKRECPFAGRRFEGTSRARAPRRAAIAAWTIGGRRSVAARSAAGLRPLEQAEEESGQDLPLTVGEPGEQGLLGVLDRGS